MSGTFVVSLTRAKDDTGRATVAFVVAHAAIASEKEVAVFLNIESTRLSQSGYPDGFLEDGFPLFKEPITRYVGAGGTIDVRADEDTMPVEFMGDACPSLSH